MTTGRETGSVCGDQRRFVNSLWSRFSVPPLAEVLLPPEVPDPSRKDEFGFVVLADGSTGPFYTCLGDTRPGLDALLSTGALKDRDPLEIALCLGSVELHRSALALGVINAVSQHLMKRGGFDPAAVAQASEAPYPCGKVGMVGYFGPLIERYLARGLEVTVIEKQPERVPAGLDLEVSNSPGGLADCDYVVCTASTLINDTLDEVLACARPRAVVNLMGPSASLLPDRLFSRGVAVVGGIVVDDTDRLRAAVADGRPWGEFCRKYQLTQDTYPGVERLLSAADPGHREHETLRNG